MNHKAPFNFNSLYYCWNKRHNYTPILLYLQDGKHLSYAQITQKKKEEREAKEAADRAAAAVATHNLNHGPVDGACGIDLTKKNIKDQMAVKQNVHGM